MGPHFEGIQQVNLAVFMHSNMFFYGEFDSGSERTLAAWIRHASRTGQLGSNIELFSGERVRNTWAIYREVGDSSPKGELIPHVIRGDIASKSKVAQATAF